MLLGYVEFVLLLFVPGAAVMEIFRLGGDYSFSERLGLAFGLSMAVDVLVLAFRTSGVVIGSQKMVGIYPGTLELLLGVSVVAFVAPVALRRRLDLYVKPSRTDLYVLGLVVVQAALVAAHFEKYPIFPQFQSVDFTQHVEITASLQAGQATMFPGGILYYGVHLLMGSLLALSGDLALVATQHAMGILVTFSPLLMFLTVDSITGSKRTGLVASLLYVSTGFVWFGSVFDAGLYPNFFGFLAILMLFALVPAVLKRPRNPGVWVAFVLTVVMGYFSHYSYVTVIPALVALPIAVFLYERKVSLASLAVPGVVILPGLVGVAAMPQLVTLLVQFVQATGGGNVPGDTALSAALKAWPVLRYIVVEVTNDVAAVVALALAALGVYVSARARRPAMWMLVVWLASLLVVAPFTETAWRFSYVALLPLLLLAAIGFDRLFPAPSDRSFKQRSKMRLRTDYRRYRMGLVAVVFILLVVDSWSWQLVADASTVGSGNNQVQHGILDAMEWMNTNTPPGSLVVSVTDSDFNYYQLLFSRNSGYAPLATPDQVVAASGNAMVPTYVVLTTVGTVQLPNASANPFSQYPTDSRFKLDYNQSGVLIYELPPVT